MSSEVGRSPSYLDTLPTRTYLEQSTSRFQIVYSPPTFSGDETATIGVNVTEPAATLIIRFGTAVQKADAIPEQKLMDEAKQQIVAFMTAASSASMIVTNVTPEAPGTTFSAYLTPNVPNTSVVEVFGLDVVLGPNMTGDDLFAEVERRVREIFGEVAHEV